MENQKFLIEKLHDNLTVTDMSILFNEFGLESSWIRMQEDIVVKWFYYISAKENCFKMHYIDNMIDDQIIFYNNRAYLLCEADGLHEAVDHFWTKLTMLPGPIGSKEDDDEELD